MSEASHIFKKLDSGSASRDFSLCSYVISRGTSSGHFCNIVTNIGEKYCHKHKVSGEEKALKVPYDEFANACREGNIEIVESTIFNSDKLLDWNGGLFKACLGGHRKIVELLIKLGAKSATLRSWEGLQAKQNSRGYAGGTALDWDRGLGGACLGGHKELILLMKDYGATDWDSALYYACKGGHKDVVDLLISYGANFWNHGFAGAKHGNQKEMMLLMVFKGASNWADADWTEKDITSLVLHGIQNLGKHDRVAWQCVNQMTVSLYKMLTVHLPDDLITIFFQYLF